MAGLMNPMMAGAYGGMGGQGGVNPMMMMGYMDPNLMGAQRQIDFGQGLMGEGTSTAPAYPMQALARALQGALGGYETHEGMQRFGDAFQGGQGQGGQDSTDALLAHTFGEHSAIRQAWLDSYRSPMIHFKLATETIPKMLEGLGIQKAGGGETFATPQVGGNMAPVGTTPVADVAKLNQIFAMPAGPARDAAMAQLQKELMVGTGRVTAAGNVEAVPGASETAASAAGAAAGATSQAELPAAITKINAGEQAKTIMVPPSTVMLKGPGGAGGSAPYTPPGPAAPLGGPPAAPPGAAEQPPVTGAVQAPGGFYGASGGAGGPAATPDAGRAAGTPAPTAAGQPPIPPPAAEGAASSGPPAGGIVRLPGGGVANTMTPQQINLGSDRSHSYRDEQGKALSASMDAVIKGGGAAQDSVRQLSELSEQLKKVPTNFGAQEIADGAKLALSFGWDVNQILPEGLRTNPVAVDAANKNIAELAMVVARANFPTGQIRNMDLMTAMKATPNLTNLPGANQILIDNLANVMRLKAEQAKFFRQYERAGPGEFATPDFEGKAADKGEIDNGVYDAWAAHVQAMPNIPQGIKSSFLTYSDYGGGNAPTPTAALGLPDGAIKSVTNKEGHKLYLFNDPQRGYYWAEQK